MINVKLIIGLFLASLSFSSVPKIEQTCDIETYDAVYKAILQDSMHKLNNMPPKLGLFEDTDKLLETMQERNLAIQVLRRLCRNQRSQYEFRQN